MTGFFVAFNGCLSRIGNAVYRIAIFVTDASAPEQILRRKAASKRIVSDSLGYEIGTNAGLRIDDTYRIVDDNPKRTNIGDISTFRNAASTAR